MSERVGDTSFIYAEKSQQCDLCGKVAELRPYGPKGETICYECGQKNSEVTERMMARSLFGVEVREPPTPPPSEEEPKP